MPKISNQTGRILDAISAGPIEGLVDGSSSVFLNDTSVSRGQLKDVTGGTSTETQNMTASFTENSNIVTVPKTEALEDLIGNLSSDFPRFLWLEGAGRSVKVANYGGVGVDVIGTFEGGGQQATAKTAGGMDGQALQTYPFERTSGQDSNFGSLFNQEDFSIKTREIIDLKKFYEDGTIEKQSKVSEIKQTFQVNTVSDPELAWMEYWGVEPVTATMTRKHFFSDLSTYTYGDHHSGQANRFHTQHDYLRDDISGEILAKTISLSSADAVARIGILGNEGNHPKGGNGSSNGNYETDFLLFDGVYKINDVKLAADNSFIEIEIDTSTDSASFKPRPPKITANNRRAHIFTVGGQNTPTGTTLRGNVQFKNGERVQSELSAVEGGTSAPRTNVIINPNTTLLLSSNFTNGTSAPTIYTSSGSSAVSLGLSALQTRQIDALRFNIIFPNGLFAIQKNGDYINGIFDAIVRFRHRNSTSDEFKEEIVRGTTKNNANYWAAEDTLASFSTNIDDGVGMRVTENKKSVFSKEVTIDVSSFHPFIDFELEIERQTPDKFDHYMAGSRIEDTDEEKQVKQFSGTAVIQYVQALFYDKFTYPLTAYAAVTFSGADFDKIPTRGYHCRGLKIKIPSNYITREEDALLSGGKGIARYSRLPSGSSIGNRTQSVSESLVLTNQLKFTFTAGELDIGRQTSDIGYWTGKDKLSSTFPAASIEPNLDDLIVSFYNDDPDGDGTLAHTERIRIRFNTSYKLYGSDLSLYKELSDVTLTDIITGDIITYDTIHAFFDEDKATPGVALNQSNYSVSNPAITAGRSYNVTMNFKNDVIRPNDYVVWNGTFRDSVYCNNPAWVFLDLLTHPEYGLGDYIKIQDVDIYELYEIARYCDELVPDGKGGLEPRFTCNVYITKPTEAYQLLKDLASTFRGMSVWQNSQIVPIQDRPKSSIYLFTQANVIDGVFNYSRQSVRAKPNSIECTWNDPEQNFRQDVLVLDDTEAQLKVGRIIPKKIVAFGCTSKAQAKRVAEWHLATNQQETKKINFATSINAGLLRVGDVISIQDHQARARIESSGRIIEAPTPDVLILDREVTLDFDNHEYIILVQIVDSVFFLREKTAIINNITYNLGDEIKFDTNGNLLAGSTLREDEIVDDNNNLLKVEKTHRTSVIQKQILPTQTATSDIVFLSSEINMLLPDQDPSVEENGLAGNVMTQKDALEIYRRGGNEALQQAFSLTADDRRNLLLKDHIWAIVTNDVEDEAIEKYRIMSIKPENNGFNTIISGIQYDESKFNKSDVRNTAFSDPFYNDTLANTVIAQPENGTAELVAALRV